MRREAEEHEKKVQAELAELNRLKAEEVERLKAERDAEELRLRRE